MKAREYHLIKYLDHYTTDRRINILRQNDRRTAQ
nr:MAG TPA: hypothetical protein [Caudoviricetes sp.]